MMNLKTFFILLGMIFLFGIIQAQEEQFYNINLNYLDGEISLESVDVLFGQSSTGTGGSYNLNVVSFDGDILNQFYFDILESEVNFETINPETGEISGESFQIGGDNLVLTAPYFPNAYIIEIYSPDEELLLEIDVSEFALCQTEEECASEDIEICTTEEECDLMLESQSDETSGDGSEEFGDETTALTDDTGEKKYGFYVFVFISVMLILLIILTILKIIIKIQEKNLQNQQPSQNQVPQPSQNQSQNQN